MPGPAPALASLGIWLLMDVNVTPVVTSRVEVAAGQAPEAPFERPKRTLVLEATPGLGARLQTLRSQLDFLAASRFFRRTPNQGDVERPLVLGLGQLNHRFEATPRLTWNTSLGGAVGESDYTNTSLSLAAPLARGIENPVVTTAHGSAQTGATYRTSEASSIGFATLGSYTTPIADIDTTLLRPTTMLGLDVEQTWQASPIVSWTVPLRGRRYFVERGQDSSSVELDVEHQRALDERTRFEVVAGLVAADADEEPLRFLPVGGVALERVVVSTARSKVTNRLAAGVTAAFDPTQAHVYPVGRVQASWTATVGTTLRPMLNLEGYTTLTRRPVSSTPTDSRAAASLALGIQLNQELLFELGGRFATSASHLSQPLELVDRQLLAYAALSYSLSSEEEVAPRTPNE
jgi:hypothetical protein